MTIGDSEYWYFTKEEVSLLKQRTLDQGQIWMCLIWASVYAARIILSHSVHSHLGLTCPHADRPSGEAAHLITRASQFVFLLELLAFVPTRVQNEDTSYLY